MCTGPFFWSVFILLFMYSSQLGNISGKAFFLVPAEVTRQNHLCWCEFLIKWYGRTVEVSLICGQVSFKALKSHSLTSPKIELSWSWFTQHKNHLYLSDAWENLGFSACSHPFSFTAPCQLFIPTPENLRVSLKNGVTQGPPGRGGWAVGELPVSCGQGKTLDSWCSTNCHLK